MASLLSVCISSPAVDRHFWVLWIFVLSISQLKNASADSLTEDTAAEKRSSAALFLCLSSTVAPLTALTRVSNSLLCILFLHSKKDCLDISCQLRSSFPQLRKRILVWIRIGRFTMRKIGQSNMRKEDSLSVCIWQNATWSRDIIDSWLINSLCPQSHESPFHCGCVHSRSW
mgnify:CR=1 FL=1